MWRWGKGNSVPLTSLPQIEGGHLRLALCRSPAGGTREQQQQREQQQRQQLQDAPARPRSAPAPGRPAPGLQPHAARSHSRVQSRSALGREFFSALGTSSQRVQRAKLFPAIVCFRWEGGRVRLTPGNNSVRGGGRGRRRRRRLWRGCCCRCHSAQNGRSWRLRRQLSSGGPSWLSRSARSGRQRSPRQLEGEEGGVSPKEQRGLEAEGGERARARKGASKGERGQPGDTQFQHPPKELPCTWCDEICLEGCTNKKNNHPADFRMTNNRHWYSLSSKESNARSSGMLFLVRIYTKHQCLLSIFKPWLLNYFVWGAVFEIRCKNTRAEMFTCQNVLKHFFKCCFQLNLLSIKIWAILMLCDKLNCLLITFKTELVFNEYFQCYLIT